MSENGEIYTAGKNFTLPLAVTAWTNLNSAPPPMPLSPPTSFPQTPPHPTSEYSKPSKLHHRIKSAEKKNLPCIA